MVNSIKKFRSKFMAHFDNQYVACSTAVVTRNLPKANHFISVNLCVCSVNLCVSFIPQIHQIWN